MLRKGKYHGRDGEAEWEENAGDDEDDGNDDEDKNVEEEFDDTAVTEGVDQKENRLQGCRCQKTRLRKLIPHVYSPAKSLPIKPLPSESLMRPSPASPQASGQPTSRAAIEGYF